MTQTQCVVVNANATNRKLNGSLASGTIELNIGTVGVTAPIVKLRIQDWPHALRYEVAVALTRTIGQGWILSLRPPVQQVSDIDVVANETDAADSGSD